MSGNSRPGRNPYVGPQPFSLEQQKYFFGRRQEIAIMRDLVMSRRAVLLFAESGAGKSSLLQAGLVPELIRQETIGRGPRRRTYQKMAVLPVASVGGKVSGEQKTPSANPYIMSVLASLDPGANPATLSDPNLAEGLALHLAHADEESGRPALATLLIFDQFEEIFTRHQSDRTQREEFFLQIRQALDEHPYLHMLFSIREDYIARLDPYAHLLPDGLRNEYRLERLRRDAALEAVAKPAELAGRRYDVDVAEALVDNLRRVQVGRLARQEAAAAGLEVPLGDFVEPVHLQIVCQQLWDKVPALETLITSSHLAQLGDVDRALINFYDDSVNKATEAGEVAERAIRRWFEDKLITPARTRGLVYQNQEQGDTAGLPNEAVGVLREAYIIRSVVRGGEVWFELAHDRLVEPILESNRQWRADYYNPVAAAYRTWQAGGEDQRLLLSGAHLDEAETFAAASPGDLRPEERTYLEESREAQAQRLAAERRRRRTRILLAAAVILVLGLVVVGVLAFQELQRANSRELALSALSSLETDPERAILLAEQAMDESHTGQAEDALRRALEESRIRQRLVISASDIDSDSQIVVTVVPEFLGGEQPDLPARNVSFWNLAYSPDGSRLAVAASDGLAAIWDMTTRGARPLILRTETAEQDGAEPERLLDVDFSPDGDLLAAAGGDGIARIWDAVTGELIHVLPSTAMEMRAVAFGPDGRTLYTGGVETLVRTWDVATSQEIPGGWLAHDAAVNDLAISHDGQALAVAGEDGTVTLWAIEDPALPLILEGHDNAVWAVAFSPDGAFLASGSQDKTVVLWSVTLPDPIVAMPMSAQLQAQQRLSLPDATDTVTRLNFSPQGRCLAAGGVDRTARVWFVETGRLFAELDGHEDSIVGLAFNPAEDQEDPAPPAERCGRELATAARNGSIRLWNTGANSSGPVLLEHLDAVESAAFSHKGDLIATGADDTQVIIWDAETLAPLRRLEGHTDRVNRVVFSTNDQFLATTSHDSTTRLWDVATGRELIVMTSTNEGDPDRPVAIYGAAYDPGGTMLATAGDDGLVRIWGLPAGEPGPVLVHNPGLLVAGVQFGPEGQLMATTSSDGYVRMFDVNSIRNLAAGQAVSANASDGPLIWRGFHGGAVYDAAFSPQGDRLASISWDNSIKIWDSSNGDEITTLEGHTDRPYSVHFSPDGRYLATTGADQTVRIWNVQGGDIVQTIPGPEFNSLDYSPDGERLVVAGEDGTTRLYDLNLERLLALARDRLTRRLTDAECNRYLHRDTCPD